MPRSLSFASQALAWIISPLPLHGIAPAPRKSDGNALRHLTSADNGNPIEPRPEIVGNHTVTAGLSELEGGVTEGAVTQINRGCGSVDGDPSIVVAGKKTTNPFSQTDPSASTASPQLAWRGSAAAADRA